MANVMSKGCDRTAQMCSLIRAFACHQCRTVRNPILWLMYVSNLFDKKVSMSILTTFEILFQLINKYLTETANLIVALGWKKSRPEAETEARKILELERRISLVK